LESDWGTNTDFEKTYMMILKQATIWNIPKEQMPTMLICLSDMQFDEASAGNEIHTDIIKKEYEKHGYDMPKLIYWNLSRDSTGSPAVADESNIALISGFSPAIMKSVLACDNFNPINVMLKSIEKYNVNVKITPKIYSMVNAIK